MRECAWMLHLQVKLNYEVECNLLGGNITSSSFLSHE